VDETLIATAQQAILAGEQVWLHPHAALFWARMQTLIVADLHLGKATHFRRNGMPVPQYVQDETFDKLSGLLLDFAPRRLLILGDLFHSDYNEEWEEFGDLMLAFNHVEFELVPGNHDRLTRQQYLKYGMKIHDEPHVEGPFAFSHHPHTAKELVVALGSEAAQGRYNLAGHVHPAARLRGRGEALRLPCFFFGKEAGLMPAFGAFTGTYTVRPQRHDRVFVLAGGKVMQVS